MKKLRAKKWFRVLTWNIFNAVLTAVIAFFTETPKEFTPIILIALNFITKYVNNTYFNDLGVTPAPVIVPASVPTPTV
jgi:hypothetical protein